MAEYSNVSFENNGKLKLLIIVGSRDTVEEMVRNDRKTLRYSGLQSFITMWRESGL